MLFAFLILTTMLETWRLIIDDPCDGATNMARDEAIATVHAAGATPPTLRLYRWQPACLSLGRFQRSGEIDREACARRSIAIVRRPSGGRALLHDEELTYAIIVRDDHPLLGGESILASYRQISLALRDGLRRLGVAAELTPVERERRAGGSAACFDAPASYELTVVGRKIAGSAQTRRDGVLLQHGAIPLAPHANRLAALIRHPPEDLDAKMIALSDACGQTVCFEELAEALVAGFAATWNIVFAPGALTDAEQQEVRLRAEKYADSGWTFAR
jgi:lipoate-protein ligase A